MKTRFKSACVTAAAGLMVLAAGTTLSGAAEYKVEEGAIKASLTGKPGDAATGKKTFINRKKGNCLACHQVSTLSEQPVHGEIGPPLDGAASRWSEGEIRLRIVNPKVENPDTIMPSFYRT